MRPGDQHSATVVTDARGETSPTKLHWTCESARSHKLEVREGKRKKEIYFPTKNALLRWTRGKFGRGNVWWEPPLFGGRS